MREEAKDLFRIDKKSLLGYHISQGICTIFEHEHEHLNTSAKPLLGPQIWLIYT